MKTKLNLVCLLIMLNAMQLNAQESKSIYDFTVTTLEGESFDFASLKGKKIMIVNTASKCGFTPQYEGLQALYDKYGDEKFVVIGFPSNDFFNEEPGSAEEIRTFCTLNYKVTFPLMEKVSVKGRNKHPVYHWLTDKKQNGVLKSKVKWNFQKYLIDEEGNLVEMVSFMTKPESDKIISWIEGD